MPIDHLRNHLDKQAPTASPAMTHDAHSTTTPAHTSTTEQISHPLAQLPGDSLDPAEEPHPLLTPRALPRSILTPNTPPSSRTSLTPPSLLSPPPPEPALAPRELNYMHKILMGLSGAVIGANLGAALGAGISIVAGNLAGELHMTTLVVYLSLHPELSFYLWPTSLALALTIGGAYIGIQIFHIFTDNLHNEQPYLPTATPHEHISRLAPKGYVLKSALACSSAAVLLGFTLTSGLALSALPMFISIPTVLACGGVAALGLAGIAKLSTHTTSLLEAGHLPSPPLQPALSPNIPPHSTLVENSLVTRALDNAAKVLKGALIITTGTIIGAAIVPALGAAMGITIGATLGSALGVCIVASLLTLKKTFNGLTYLANQPLSCLSKQAINLSVGILSFSLILHPLLSVSVLPASLALALGISGACVVNDIFNMALWGYSMYLEASTNEQEPSANREQFIKIIRLLDKGCVLKTALAFSSAACLLGFTLTSGLTMSALPVLISVPSILAFSSATALSLSKIATLSRQTMHLFSQVAARFSSSQPLPAAT